MKLKVFIFSALMILFLSIISWIFWEQEVKYALPTPIPLGFKDVEMGQSIDLSTHINTSPDKSLLLHFYSDQCPCSRFNMKEFERLGRKYQEDIDFYVVIQSEEEGAAKKFEEKYELALPTILDVGGAISDLCGIYATPQAVILDNLGKLFFKGNYNKARFCTRKETRFVDLALEHLIAGKTLPLDIRMALTQPYGCTLPSDEAHHLENSTTLSGIFN